MSTLASDPGAVERVALAIAKVVADRVVQDDPKLAGLDGLGRIMAMNELAQGMVRSLTFEATAALEAVDQYLAEGTLQ